MTHRCEIHDTNRGNDPGVLAAHVDEITGGLIRRKQKEFQ